MTKIALPSANATLQGGTWLDASATNNTTSVEFCSSAARYGFSAPVVCTATLTYFGWLCGWDTTTVPNGSYVLVSVAVNSVGTAASPGVAIKVNN